MEDLHLSSVGVVILAAGHGKRMQSSVPKVMLPLKSQSLLEYAVAVVEKFNLKPVVVVSAHADEIRNYFGDRVAYALQREPLGTGHAVGQAKKLLKGKVEHVLVLYGDMPFITSISLSNLIKEHVAQQATMTLATVTVSDFKGWRAALYDFGRIVHDANGAIAADVEKRDATPKQMTTRELNSGFYCFRTVWLWDSLKKIKNNNAQKEYYLTDLIALAVVEGKKIASVAIDPREAIGINTKEGLEMAERLINNEKSA